MKSYSYIYRILTAMSISMAVMMSSGCSSEKMPDPIKDIPETSGTELAVSVALSGPTRADGNSGFEKGEGYENYLDKIGRAHV